MDAHESLVASLRAALAVRPADTTLRLHLAKVMLEAGDLPGAMSEAAEALTREPGSDEARDFMLTALSPAAPTPPPPPAAPTPPTTSTPTPAVPEPREAESPVSEPPPTERWPDAEQTADRPDAVTPPATGQDRTDGGFDWTAAESDLDGVIGPRFADEPATPADTYEVEKPGLRLADIGGMEDVKERLEIAFLAPMRNPELRALYGKSLRGGLLLYGPPGCGKTFVARAVAGELGASFIVVGISDVLDMYFGQSEHNLRELFEAARRKAPCVVFLDEIDALGMKRSQTRSGGMRTLVNQMLEEMDSVSSNNDGVFVLGATNQPWDVDTALRRPGRFDRTLLVLPPDLPARRAILALHLRDRPVENIELNAIAARTNGFSGADLAHLCESAAERALLDSARSGTVRMIGMGDFEAALTEVKPSTGPWFDSARSVAMFANEGGAYDDLLAYLKQQKML